MKIGEVVVIVEVALNSNENKKVFLMAHLTDSPSISGRGIHP